MTHPKPGSFEEGVALQIYLYERVIYFVHGRHARYYSAEYEDWCRSWSAGIVRKYGELLAEVK